MSTRGDAGGDATPWPTWATRPLDASVPQPRATPLPFIICRRRTGPAPGVAPIHFGFERPCVN